jgi:hypothetical protein
MSKRVSDRGSVPARYQTLTTETGVVVYDSQQRNAWIESDVYVDVDP